LVAFCFYMNSSDSHFTIRSKFREIASKTCKDQRKPFDDFICLLRRSRPSFANLPSTSQLFWHEPALLQAAATAGLEGWRDFVLCWGRHSVRSPRPHKDETEFFSLSLFINTLPHHYICYHGTLFIKQIPSV